MNKEYRIVSLKTLAGGSAVAQFDEALTQAYTNILDLNTDARKKRVIKLTLTLYPDDKRERISYVFSVDKKLAPDSAIDSVMYIGHDEGEIIARESNMEQLNLFKPQLVEMETERS